MVSLTYNHLKVRRFGKKNRPMFEVNWYAPRVQSNLREWDCLGSLLPALSPNLGAHEIAAIYQKNTLTMRSGFLLVMA